MDETSLRWKARIGALKPFAALVLILAVVGLGASISLVVEGTRNADGPQQVTIGQLVDGTVGSSRYVTVSGRPLYDAGYTETSDGNLSAVYYLLLDDGNGALIVVKASSLDLSDRPGDKAVTVTGMTHSTDSGMQALIERDISGFRGSGYETNARLYLDEGDTPADPLMGSSCLGVSAIVILPCIATFFFPSVVFAPQPADITAVRPQTQVRPPEAKATGRFQKLKRMDPAVEVGRGSRKFNNAVANIIPMASDQLMVYIHHIVRVQYGIPVSKTHWGVSLDRVNVSGVETGKLYGWKDRWAVRFHYKGLRDKPETLTVSFEQPWAQADFVNLLRQKGFVVGGLGTWSV